MIGHVIVKTGCKRICLVDDKIIVTNWELFRDNCNADIVEKNFERETK